MPLDLPPANDAVARRSSIVVAITQLRFSENPAVSEPATGVRFHELLGGPEGRYPQINQARRALINIGPGGQGAEHESSGWRMTAEGWLGCVELLLGGNRQTACIGHGDEVTQMS